MQIIDEIKLSKELIKFPSVTPIDAGAIKFLSKKLKSLGFKCKILEFRDKKSPTIKNLYARIGNKELNIYGGSYCIPPDNLKEFYKLYYEHVFVKKRKEYLTEKQLLDTGPILVDFDFRYTADVDTRMHTNEHVQDLIQLYLEEIKLILY